jgi:hypothetical protein
VIGSRHLADQTCANDRLIRPALWLTVTGAITFAGIALTIMILCCAAASGDAASGGLILFRWFSTLFSTIWTIVGAVSLWRDNLACPPGELHDMIWASVIINFISVVILLFGGKGKATVI